MCPRHHKTPAGHHPFTWQAHVPSPVAAGLQELGHEGKETHPKPCCRHPELDGTVPIHPTSCPGAAAGWHREHVQHPCPGWQPARHGRVPALNNLVSFPEHPTAPALPTAQGCGQAGLCPCKRRRKGGMPEKLGLPAGSAGGLSLAHLRPCRAPALREEVAATTRGHPCPPGALRDRARHIQTPPQLRAEANKQQARGKEGTEPGPHLGHPQGSGAHARLPQTLPPRQTRLGTRRSGSPHPVRARRDAMEPGQARDERAGLGAIPAALAGLPQGRPYLGAWRQSCPGE